ncbi:hypothetical protein [Streptomyces sp. A5-4]|uniref:hypothetical protein n=1 Tax=Streptomyces sp. A5-4 TaxID=3384771 RepID=UPI003DA8A5C2
MAVISGELHCDAVRVSGGDPVRPGVAAEAAAGVGLEVWFAPFPVDLPAEEMPASFFADCAQRAEAVRVGGAEVVFVAGCEISTFENGFIPGATYGDRLDVMAGADPEWRGSLGPVLERLNGFLREAVGVVREHFGGRVTYAAGPWAFIDWGPFDLVGVDAYRAAYTAETFQAEIREHFKHGKPVAVTEYGTCAYRGAAEPWRHGLAGAGRGGGGRG